MAKRLWRGVVVFGAVLAFLVEILSIGVVALTLSVRDSAWPGFLLSLGGGLVVLGVVAWMARWLAKDWLSTTKDLVGRLETGMAKNQEVPTQLPGAPELEHVLEHFNELIRRHQAAELELFLIGKIFEEVHKIKNDDSVFEIFKLLNQILDGLKQASGFDRLMVLLREDDQLVVRLSVGFDPAPEGQNLPFSGTIGAFKDAFLTRQMVPLSSEKQLASELPDFTQAFGPAKSGVVIPLFNRGEVTGFFVADTQNPANLTEAKLHSTLVLTNFLGFTFEKLDILRQIRNLAHFDEATLAYNRKYFSERLKEEVKKANRYQQVFGLILVRLGPYDSLVREQGIEKGEDLARLVASFIMRNVREVDLLCRYQDQSFILMLPQTSVEGVALLAGRLEESLAGIIREDASGDSQCPALTWSFVTFPENGDKAEELLHHLLRQGASGGRND